MENTNFINGHHFDIVSIPVNNFDTLWLKDSDVLAAYTIHDYKEDLQNIKNFLIFKNIEIDEQKFKDFVDSRELIKRMSDDEVNDLNDLSGGYLKYNSIQNAPINNKIIINSKLLNSTAIKKAIIS